MIKQRSGLRSLDRNRRGFMKFILVSFLFISCLSFADDKIATQRDFFVICESSKFSQALKKSQLFLDAEAERVVLVAKMFEMVATSDAKNAIQGISLAAPSDKLKLLKQAAREAGIKNWNCPTAKYLFQ